MSYSDNWPWPTVGRTVHYYEEGYAAGEGDPICAFITGVSTSDPPTCNLAILTTDSLRFLRDVPWTGNAWPGSWTWPPRVP